MSERADIVPDPLTVAVRVWTTRTATPDPAEEDVKERSASTRRKRKRRYPTEALIFDTETETGPAQRLRLLVWRFYSDAPGKPPGYRCIEEGLAYPNDLPDRDPEGFRILQEEAMVRQAEVAPGFGDAETASGLMFKPLTWWLEHRLFRYGYAHRNRCSVVGFNLPFDLTRVASHWSEGRGPYRGGWSLGLWGAYNEKDKWHDRRYRPRLLLKAIDPRRTLFGWGTLKGGDGDDRGDAGRFIDLRTLTFALTDKSHTLETACAAFGDPFAKPEVDYGQLTPELIGYALEDVRHTGLLYRHALAELAVHEGVMLDPHRLFSPATVGARYLEAMGMTRPLEKFTALTPDQLGWTRRNGPPANDKAEGGIGEDVLGFAMSAFYGGRAEARIVRTPVPVAHVDFTSMYPAVNELLGTWKILRAAHIEVVEATDEARELLTAPELLERCLTRDFWHEIGVTLVQVKPDGDILPVRATYQPNSEDLGIGVNPLTYDGHLWYALSDVIAAALLGSNPPTITRALRLKPHGIQDGLEPVKLRGGAPLDPTGDRDPFLEMIEERVRVKADPDLAKAERDRLELFLKITANATAYGSLARFDRRDLPDPTHITVHGPDGQPHEKNTATPEDPGPFCFPPVACSITAGARLMLATLERLVTDAGGSYAFCDTDSMAIVATRDGDQIPCPTADGTTITALTWTTVQEILNKFHGLNPYDPELLQPWKVEHNSLENQLHCYAISAKRYLLYRTTSDNGPELVAASDYDDAPVDDSLDLEDPLTDWSEHGLGLYQDPVTRPANESGRDKEGRRLWIREAWEWILTNINGTHTDPPAWSSRYALTQFNVSSPALARWFAGYNYDHAPEDQIRPSTFGLIAHLDIAFNNHGPASDRSGRLPAAPFEREPEQWPELEWYDRASGTPIRVLAGQDRHQPDRFAYALADGAVVLDTLANVLTRYLRRPEHKSRAPTGMPAASETTGRLQRRPVAGTPAATLLTGKEGNKLLERLTGEITDTSAYRNDYGTLTAPWTDLIHPVLREIGAAALIKTGIPRSTAYRIIHDADRPHAETLQHLSALAAAHAAHQLDETPTADPLALLARYRLHRLDNSAVERRCEWCGAPIPNTVRGDARYHSDACRQAARRSRLRSGQ